MRRPPDTPGVRTGNIVYKINRAHGLHLKGVGTFDVLAEITIEHGLVADDVKRCALRYDFAVMQHDNCLCQRHDRAHDMLD